MRTTRRYPPPRGQDGFSLIEVLTAIMVLAIVAGGLAAGLTQTSFLLGRSKSTTVAEKIAQQRLEVVRTLDYDDVGTVSGNPPGTLVADSTETVDGATYRVQQAVTYVDNPAPGASQTRIDYKRVVVSVVPTAGGDTSSEATIVAPPEYASIAGRAAIVISAQDGLTGDPVPDAAVRVSGGPSPTSNDVTDATGNLVVPGLLPSTTQTYTTAISKTGYVVTNPATDFSTRLSAGQTFPIAAVLLKPVSVEVNLHRGTTTTAIPESATVTLTSPSGASGSITGTGPFTFTTLGGLPILPSNSQDYTVDVSTVCRATYSGPARVSPGGYPTNLTDVEAIDGFTRGTITTTVRNAITSLPIANATVTITGGDANLTGTDATTTTDANGEAVLCVPATTTSAYTVRATHLLLSDTGTVRPLASEGSAALTLRPIA